MIAYSWDENKRLLIVRERGLDFADAHQIFDGVHVDEPDERFDYGESRMVTFGFLAGRICAVVWTPREHGKHLISLRKANDREQKNTKPVWVDPDDAPDMGDSDFFERGDWYHGDTLIRRGRPKLETPKVSTTLRLDADVIAQFKAKGPKWQTRINDALREWLKTAG